MHTARTPQHNVQKLLSHDLIGNILISLEINEFCNTLSSTNRITYDNIKQLRVMTSEIIN